MAGNLRKGYSLVRACVGSTGFSSSSFSLEEPKNKVQLPSNPLFSREVLYTPRGSVQEFCFRKSTETEIYNVYTEKYEQKNSSNLMGLTGLVALALSISLLPVYICGPIMIRFNAKFIAGLQTLDFKDYIIISCAILPVVYQYIIDKRKEIVDKRKDVFENYSAKFGLFLQTWGVIEQKRSTDVMEEFLKERDKSGYKKAKAAELDEYRQILQLFLKVLKARPEDSDPLNLESDRVIHEMVETLLEALEPKEIEANKKAEHDKALDDYKKKLNDNGEGKPK